MIRDRGPAYPRVGVTATVLATALAILAVRLAWLGTAAAKHADAVRPELTVPAPRGTLWDRDGALLAVESYAYDVAAVPRDIRDRAAFAAAVAPHLGVEPGQVLSDLAAASEYWAILGRGLSKTQAEALRELGLTGLRLERKARRSYPLGAAAAHITGFWNPYEEKPFYGVELRFDRELQGRPGALTGNMGSDPRFFRAARRGTDLVLTIDRDIQLAATDALAQVLHDESALRGTVLVLDPATGAILASVSLPSFDPNRYSESDPATFSDPAVASVYEPGSVIKAYTMAAALDAGIASPGATYVDEGSIDVDGAPIYNWDQLPHGEVSMTTMLEKSLNVGAVYLGLGLGAERFYGYMQAFGFGAPIGADLEGEVGGILHVPGEGATNAQGTLARASFGQAMAATPLQVAAAMAAVANDGLLMAPHVVAARIPASGELVPAAPQPLRQVIRPETARALRTMLESVVSGHVTAAAVPGYRIGGKTGTSQIPQPGGYDDEKTIASFCGFLPVDQPRLVILVKVDRPEAPRGSDVAAPVFRTVAEAAIAALDIPPDNPDALLKATEAGP